MPYIVQKDRDLVDHEINDLVEAINSRVRSDIGARPGILNYTISRLGKCLYDIGYRDINEFCGVLSCVQLEFYRKVAAPYEDIKEATNGPVY